MSNSRSRPARHLVVVADEPRTQPAAAMVNPWAGSSTWAMLEAAAVAWPRQEAVIDGGIRLTFETLLARADSVAAGFEEAGVGPGSRVGLLAANSWMQVVAIYAALRCGATVVLLNPAWRRRELTLSLVHSEVELLVADAGSGAWELGLVPDGPTDNMFLPRLRGVVAMEGHRSSVKSWAGRRRHAAQPPLAGEMLFYTAKFGEHRRGVRVDPAAALGCAHHLGERLEVTSDDRHLNLSALRHTAGVIDSMLAMHQRGAAVCLYPAFDPARVAQLAARERCTVTGGPSVLARRVMEAADVPGLRRRLAIRRLWSAPRIDADGLLERLGVWQLGCYGLSEASNLVTMSVRGEGSEAGAGRPLPGVDVRILDMATGLPLPAGQVGEIAFRGWNLTPGYHREPNRVAASSDATGLFRTGDLGCLDEAGNLHFAARLGNTLRSGGELISAGEIESVIDAELESVSRVAVVGVIDPTWGEAAVAVVQPADGSPVTLRTLHESCSNRLAGYKLPKYVVCLGPHEWPVLPDGATDRARLRELAAARVHAAVSLASY